MQILQDNQLMEKPNEKIGINDIYGMLKAGLKNLSVYFVSRRLGTNRFRM